MNFIENFTGYSDDTTEQSGCYLALKFDAPEGAEITIQVIGGISESEPVEVDSENMNVVVRIADSQTQNLKVTCTLDGHSDYAKVYHLNELELEEGK